MFSETMQTWTLDDSSTIIIEAVICHQASLNQSCGSYTEKQCESVLTHFPYNSKSLTTKQKTVKSICLQQYLNTTLDDRIFRIPSGCRCHEVKYYHSLWFPIQFFTNKIKNFWILSDENINFNFIKYFCHCLQSPKIQDTLNKDKNRSSLGY